MSINNERRAEQCPVTCANFSLNDCKEAHRCVLDEGHPFDPMFGEIHRFVTHMMPVEPRSKCIFPAPPEAEKEATPLCPVHQRLEDSNSLECEIGGNNCVACSLNERAELLDVLAPFAAKDGSEDSLTVMRRIAGFYETHQGGNRVVVSYPAPTPVPVDAPTEAAVPAGEASLTVHNFATAEGFLDAYDDASSKAEIERLNAEVARFSTLADERHDLLCAERRKVDDLRAEIISLNSDWKVMRDKWASARASALDEAIQAVKARRQENDTGAAYESGYNFAIGDAVEEIESLKGKLT